MRLSLAVGLLMVFGKVTAYVVTHSAAILSDAAESVVHVVAVAFATFSLRLSAKPAEAKFLYGYERVTFRMRPAAMRSPKLPKGRSVER